MSTVFWLTGLSGAGKTTIARELVSLRRADGQCCVLLDGDQLRDALGNRHGYGVDDRKTLAFHYAGLARMLSEQGVDVVCATVSLFPEVWEWSRDHVADYFEVYVRAAPETLRRRDKKGLYSEDPGMVVGRGIRLPEPLGAHLVLDNDGPVAPRDQARAIVKAHGERGGVP